MDGRRPTLLGLGRREGVGEDDRETVMDDIVEHLRREYDGSVGIGTWIARKWLREAADEIERLRKLVDAQTPRHP